MSAGRRLDVGVGVLFALHPEMDDVEIRFAKATALDGDESGLAQFRDEFIHTGAAHAHVLREPFLPRKAVVVSPGVAEEHGVGNFGSKGQRRIAEDKIGDLGKAFPSNRIKGVQLDVLLLDQFAEGLHGRLIIS